MVWLAWPLKKLSYKTCCLCSFDGKLNVKEFLSSRVKGVTDSCNLRSAVPSESRIISLGDKLSRVAMVTTVHIYVSSTLHTVLSCLMSFPLNWDYIKLFNLSHQRLLSLLSSDSVVDESHQTKSQLWRCFQTPLSIHCFWTLLNLSLWFVLQKRKSFFIIIWLYVFCTLTLTL